MFSGTRFFSTSVLILCPQKAVESRCIFHGITDVKQHTGLGYMNMDIPRLTFLVHTGEPPRQIRDISVPFTP